jgi:hypothetical protein
VAAGAWVCHPRYSWYAAVLRGRALGGHAFHTHLIAPIGFPLAVPSTSSSSSSSALLALLDHHHAVIIFLIFVLSLLIAAARRAGPRS